MLSDVCIQYPVRCPGDGWIGEAETEEGGPSEKHVY